MKDDLKKKIMPYIVAIIVFVTITILYCFPHFQGKVLQQGDTMSWTSMVQESLVYAEKTDSPTWWTGSMFSGMPTFQIGTPTTIGDFKSNIHIILHLFFSSIPGIIIGYFIGFFILMRAFGVNKWLSIVGAIAIAFSSYFFIIIEAGHNTKAAAIGNLAVIIGGFFLTFNKKYLIGVPLILLFVFIGIMQHPQMSYYIFLTIGILILTELYIHIKEKKLKDFFISTAIFIGAVSLGLGAHVGMLKANIEYSKETMRGGHSELVKESSNETLSKNSGLSLEYATQWSYGIDESLTFLIPNFKGASSHYYVGEDSDVYKEMINKGVPVANASSFVQSLPMYWGAQPFTSGPVYMGAIVCFLFVLSLFIVKGPYKWGLLTAIIFSILLSWGSNFMWFTELFFNYFPMYSKFRAVSSVLIVAEITMPLLGFLALKAIMDKEISKAQIVKAIKQSAGITAGICTFFALLGGSLFSFSSPNDAQIFTQLPEWLSSAIISERASMLRSDAFRSLIFILLTAGLLWYFVQEKLSCKYFILGLGILIMADMIPVNLRFFNHDNFIEKKQNDDHFKMQAYEQAILQDNDPHFRVLNLAANTFNDARTSYRLKSIGGYHAAKLRRYQDLIDAHISKNNMDVINMLNTKYIIIPGQNGQPTPQQNPGSMGNAWFVDTLKLVDTPNEESEALNHINLKTTAVTDKKFIEQVKLLTSNVDSTAKIVLTEYTPNRIEYQSTSNIDKTAVFSEIYYPYGWKAYIDDKPVEHFRVNYVLRALNIPAGEHRIHFEFQPNSLRIGDIIGWISISAILILSIGMIILYFYKEKQQHNS